MHPTRVRLPFGVLKFIFMYNRKLRIVLFNPNDIPCQTLKILKAYINEGILSLAMIHLHLLKDKNICLKKYLFRILKPNSKKCREHSLR